VVGCERDGVRCRVDLVSLFADIIDDAPEQRSAIGVHPQVALAANSPVLLANLNNKALLVAVDERDQGHVAVGLVERLVDIAEARAEERRALWLRDEVDLLGHRVRVNARVEATEHLGADDAPDERELVGADACHRLSVSQVGRDVFALDVVAVASLFTVVTLRQSAPEARGLRKLHRLLRTLIALDDRTSRQRRQLVARRTLEQRRELASVGGVRVHDSLSRVDVAQQHALAVAIDRCVERDADLDAPVADHVVRCTSRKDERRACNVLRVVVGIVPVSPVVRRPLHQRDPLLGEVPEVFFEHRRDGQRVELSADLGLHGVVRRVDACDPSLLADVRHRSVADLDLGGAGVTCVKPLVEHFFAHSIK